MVAAFTSGAGCMASHHPAAVAVMPGGLTVAEVLRDRELAAMLAGGGGAAQAAPPADSGQG